MEIWITRVTEQEDRYRRERRTIELFGELLAPVLYRSMQGVRGSGQTFHYRMEILRGYLGAKGTRTELTCKNIPNTLLQQNNHCNTSPFDYGRVSVSQQLI